jgi:hypothetical protein
MFQEMKNKLKNIIIYLIQRDKEIYYDRFFGTSDSFSLFFKNLFKTHRIEKKQKYGRWISLPEFFLKGKPYPKHLDEYINTPQLKKSFQEFNDTGVCVVPNFFSVEEVDNLLKSLDCEFDLKEMSSNYIYSNEGMNIRINKEVASMWLNSTLIAMIAKYMGRFPYARNYPGLSHTCPNYDTLKTRDFSQRSEYNSGLADLWHFDTPNLVQFAVLLNDVEKNDSHMQVVANTHRKHHQNFGPDDYWISDEYIEKRKFDIVNCVGPKGTVYCFDSNAYHRLFAVKGSSRTQIKFDFTPGNNILMSCEGINASLKHDPKILETIPDTGRQVLSGLFPTQPKFGYNMEREGFVNNYN